MSDLALRSGLIRLAHEQPRFRAELLPLLKEAGCEKLPEGPMRDNCEAKGKEKGEAKTAKLVSRQEVLLRKYLDAVGPGRAASDYDELPQSVRDALIRVKDSETLWSDVNRWLMDNNNPHLRSMWAGCEKLPEGAMRDNCEKKSKSGDKEASRKQGGMAVVRRVVTLAVRVLSIKKDPIGNPNDLHVLGQISMDFGQTDPDSVRFVATVSKATGALVVTAFQPAKPVSGSGAAGVLKMLQSALQEALDAKGETLLAPGLR